MSSREHEPGGALGVALAAGDARLEAGDLAGACAELARAVELGAGADAVELGRHILEVDPEAPLSRAAMGKALDRAGEPGQAAAWFTRAAREGPALETAAGLTGLAHLHLKAGRRDEARTRLAEALTAVPDHPLALALLARFALEDGDLKAFAKHAESAVGRLPVKQREELVDVAADHLLAERRTKAFLRIASAAVHDRASSPLLAAAYAVGILEHSPKRAAAALTLLEPHLEGDLPPGVTEQIRSLTADALCVLAETARKKRDRARAYQLYRRAVDIDPDHGRARVGKGWLLIELRRADEAVDILRTAPGLPGAGEAAWVALGRAYLELGKHSHALVCAERGGMLARRDPLLWRLLKDAP